MVIKYIRPVKPASGSGLVADVYAQVKQDFGRVVEPFLIHSPLPKLLAGAWMVCRETELVGTVSRSIKEAVAASVSQLNQCPYCVDAHTIMLKASGDQNTANAIGKGQDQKISDTKTRNIVNWALATTSPKSELLRSPPFSAQEAPEIIGTALFYHYMNRMANALLGNTPLPSNQSWLKSPMTILASSMFSGAVRRRKEPGESLKFLPKAELPNDLRWVKASANVAQAFACFASVIEEVGEYALPQEVRVYVEEQLSEWTGKTSELNLAWAEDSISRFDQATESAADLALLAALAPYKIDEKAISNFRKYFVEDEKLVGTLAWASFAAAKKIGTWLNSN